MISIAYNSEEYEAWVTGFNNLLTAIKYPTPYDFKSAPLIDRIVHNYRPYEVVPPSLFSTCDISLSCPLICSLVMSRRL